MDKNYLYQVDIREWIEDGLDAEIMVPVSGNRVDKKYDVYIQSFLLPIDAVEADMENDTYNAHSMEPGITVYGSWENDEKCSPCTMSTSWNVWSVPPLKLRRSSVKTAARRLRNPQGRVQNVASLLLIVGRGGANESD